MSIGRVIGIYIAPQRGKPTVWVEQAHVIPGHGIEGDRYFQEPGIRHGITRTGRELTLIEMEAIESMCQDGVNISPDKTRRNIITHGVSLNDLVGKKFSVGEIQLLGIRLCEPCDYLASRTDPKIKQSMTHRGGLRADILTEGFIRINDPILASA
jgi:MOSC domain-containing protein YiiM